MKASDLRGILTYIPSFRDKLFVLCVDSAVLEDERAASLFLDISVLRSLNIRVVLVHGASSRIKKIAAEMKVKPRKNFGSLQKYGANDGVRTRDPQIHNLML